MKPPHALPAASWCAAAAMMPTGAAAQATEPWQLQGTLYLYVPTISSQTTFGPPPGTDTGVGIDGDTLLDHLKMTFMGAIEARRGAWGGFTDVAYYNFGASKSASRDLTIGGQPLPVGASADLDYDLKGWAWTLAGTWRVLPDVAAPTDLFAGARLLNIDQTLDWKLGGNIGTIAPPARAGSSTSSLHHWDAIVGVKGRYAFGAQRQWFVPYYLDVGSGESKSTWQAMAGIGYGFGWGDVIAAWRHLDYRMKSGDQVQSLSFDGPAIAAAWRW